MKNSGIAVSVKEKKKSSKNGDSLKIKRLEEIVAAQGRIIGLIYRQLVEKGIVPFCDQPIQYTKAIEKPNMATTFPVKGTTFDIKTRKVHLLEARVPIKSQYIDKLPKV